MYLPCSLPMSSVFYYYIPFSLIMLSILLSFLMLLTFIKLKRSRMNSGELIKSIIFFEFMFSLFLLANFFYAENSYIYKFERIGFEISPQIFPFSIFNDYDFVCQILGGVFICLISFIFCLNLCLTHNLYIYIRFKELKYTKERFIKYLVFSAFVCFGFCLYAFLKKEIGSGELGYCGIKENSKLEIVIVIFLFLIFISNSYVGVYVLKNKKELVKTLKQEQNNKSSEEISPKMETDKQKEKPLSSVEIIDPTNNRTEENVKSNSTHLEKIIQIQTEQKAENSMKLQFELKNQIQCSLSNFEIFIKINLYYMIIFMITWIPLGILSFRNFWCNSSDNCYKTNFEDIIRLIGLYVMCFNNIFLFFTRINETHVKKKMAKLLYIWQKKDNKKRENDIKNKLIKQAIKNERIVESYSKQTSIMNNTEVSKFDSNFSFEMMRKDNDTEMHPETQSDILNAMSSKCFSSTSKDKGEVMNEMMTIFLIIPYLLCKLDKIQPETQFSEVLIASIDAKMLTSPIENKLTFKHQVGNSTIKSNSFSKEEEKKDSLVNEMGEVKKESMKDPILVQNKKSIFKSPPWTDYLYNKYYLEEVEISELMKSSFEIMSTFKMTKKIITCIAYNKEYFDWVYEFSGLNRVDIIKSFGLIENRENLKKIKELKIDLEIKTADSQFFLKIISKDIKKFLVEKYFKNYHLYVHQQKNTFLPKIIGLFSFQFHSNNSNISFILYENPFVTNQKTQEKTDILGFLKINNLKIQKRIIFNEEKIEDHRNSNSFTVKEDDLKLQKDEKHRLLEILGKDISFIAGMQLVKYSFVMFFYKFNDKVILNALHSDDRRDIIEKQNVVFNLNLKRDILENQSDFGLRNGIGYCVATFSEIFSLVKNNDKKKKKLEKSGDISQPIHSVKNSELYGQSIFEFVQDL